MCVLCLSAFMRIIMNDVRKFVSRYGYARDHPKLVIFFSPVELNNINDGLQNIFHLEICSGRERVEAAGRESVLFRSVWCKLATTHSQYMNECIHIQIFIGSLIFVTNISWRKERTTHTHHTTAGESEIWFQWNLLASCEKFVTACMNSHFCVNKTHKKLYSFAFVSGGTWTKQEHNKNKNDDDGGRVPTTFNLKHRWRLLNLSYNQNKRSAFSHVAEDLTHNHIVVDRC